MNRPRSVFRTVVAPVIVAIAVIPTLAIAVWETLHGHGAASYSNVYGLTIPFVSVLILVLVLVLALAVAYIARIVYFRCNQRDDGAKIHKIASSVNSGEATNEQLRPDGSARLGNPLERQLPLE
jgi:hypothetical protein